MSVATRALLADLDALERSMRALLALVESPSARDESLSIALERCLELTPTDAALQARCAAVPTSERESVAVVMRRVVDLNAIVRSSVASALTTTAVLIDRARAARANLDALSAGSSGSTVDCVS